MKTYFACILLIICTLNLSAQSKFSVGIEGGGGVSFKSPNIIYSPHSCYNLGANFNYALTESFSVQTGLSYEDKRTRNEFLISDSLGNPLYDYNIVSSSDYLSIPLMVRKSLGQKVKFMMSAGLNFGFLLGEEAKDLNNNMASTTAAGYYKTFDLGLLLGVGTIIPLSERINLNCELRNNLGLTDMRNDRPENSSKDFFNATYLLLGLNYQL